MKKAVDEIKSEVQTKLSYWNNLKSWKVKASLIVLFIALICLKVFTTVLTYDWLTSFFKSM